MSRPLGNQNFVKTTDINMTYSCNLMDSQEFRNMEIGNKM